MIIKYDIEIKDEAIIENINKIINQIFKLLPMREEGLDWVSPLKTLIIDIGGMSKLLSDSHTLIFLLLCKLEELLTLTGEDDFFVFRKTIFEALGILTSLKEDFLNE